MEGSLLFEELFLLLSSIFLIYLASGLNFGVRRSVYLFFAGLNSLIFSIIIIIQLLEKGLAPGESILSIYSLAILFGLIVHFFANFRKRRRYSRKIY